MYKHFTIEEFACKETGKNEMKEEFILKLDNLRHLCDFPFAITSGYRDPSHSAEAHKTKGGTHTQGIAADIRCVDAGQRHKIIKEAMKLGFTGIGVAKTFVHVDTRTTTRPVLWTYS